MPQHGTPACHSQSTMTSLIITLLCLLLAGSLVALVVVMRGKDKAITDLRLEEQAIVEGAMRVTASSGGALYLLDASGKSLVPRFHSDHCAPLVDLPERIAAMGRGNASALLSFLRLHTVRPDEGVVGGVYTQQHAEIILDLRKDSRLGGSGGSFQNNTTVMIGPLSFGPKKLGIMAVTAPRDQRGYNTNDFEVFKSLVEQSAFALANAMAHQAASEKKQIEAELRSASDIQRILLPERDPTLEGYVIAGRNIPAKVLSGDYYDYIPLNGGGLGAVIADVSGKGTAAAIITAMCRSVLRFSAQDGTSPAATLAAVNRQLFPDIRQDMFISMIYLTLKPGGGLMLARAGHTLPLIWRKQTGKIESLHSGGLAVGIDKGSVFERVTKDLAFEMEVGDCLLLYTDGVNEALDAKGLEYGEERIHATLAHHAPQGAHAIVEGLIADVDKFLGGRRGHDDITLIALQKTA